MTKPVDMVSAISDSMFRLKPARYMTANVPTRDTGTTMLGISAALALRRNRNTTSTTRITEMISVRSTSCSEARIVGVRSITTLRSMAPGMDARNSGNRPRTRATVAMMLAPGWRYTIIMTAGLPLNSPALRTSCTESSTLATSPMRTAAPLWNATITGM